MKDRHLLAVRQAGCPEAAPHPAADEQPEHDRRRQRADDSVALAEEADELALRQ